MFRRSNFHVPLLMISVLMGIELTLLALARLPSSSRNTDPFTPYEAIMPGQPSAALEPFSCHSENGLEKEFKRTTRCLIQPDDGIFAEVIVLFRSDDRISEVTFIPKGLRLGDLVQRWGFPEVNHYKGFLNLRWPEQGFYTVVSVMDAQQQPFLSVMLPIYSIILTAVAT